MTRSRRFRGIDTDPGWINRRFRDLERDVRQLAAARRLERSSVNGGVATVRDLLADPAGPQGFRNNDSATWPGTGDLEIRLTQLPSPDSLQVKLNGHKLERDDWAYAAGTNTVTIPAESWWKSSAEIGTAYYRFDMTALPPAPILPTFRAYSPGSIDAFNIPGAAIVGDLLVAVAMVPSSRTVDPHGWTLVRETEPVTHAARFGTFTYRMVVLATVWDGTSTVPTINSSGFQATCLMVAFENGETVDGSFAILADGLTADTPAAASSLRVWGTIGNLVTIVPSQGAQVGYSGGDDIDIVMTLDGDSGAVAASVDSNAGWCLATLAVH